MLNHISKNTHLKLTKKNIISYFRNGGGNQIRIERIGHDPFVYNFQ